MKDEELLDKIEKWHSYSTKLRSTYESRWAKNMRLLQGIWEEDEKARSAVRNRSKIFFRKIWATEWRLVAAIYNAFLRDLDTFKISGRGPEDVHLCGVLQSMVEYRRDMMMRKSDFFLQILWTMFDILSFGVGVGKLPWNYDGKKNDQPEYIAYPPEQVFLDMSASTPHKMRYIIFEDYRTLEEMEELGYSNIDKAEPEAIPSNPLRSARFVNVGDPLWGARENEYPSPGRVSEGRKDSIESRYRIWEVFYKQDGEWFFAVSNAQNTILKKAIENPYGDIIPAVIGNCLTTPHMLIGEGFPGPLEGPQESFNFNLNLRKDNVALALNKPTIVSRYGGVDMQSLVNRRPGGVVLADDVNAIKELELRDVTGSSYQEALIDDAMSQEMSGVTPGKQGMGTETKATVANINYSESNAKIDLFLAIIGDTFFKDLFYKLAKMEARFETDKKIIRIANENFRNKIKTTPEAGEIEEFDVDFDCEINVGQGTVGRQFEIQQNLLVMDRMITANQAQLGLMQLLQGSGVPAKVKFFNVGKILEATLPKLGIKNVDEYAVEVTIPPAQQQGQGGMPAGLQGAIQPQVGSGQILAPENELQRGGAGGI